MLKGLFIPEVSWGEQTEMHWDLKFKTFYTCNYCTNSTKKNVIFQKNDNCPPLQELKWKRKKKKRPKLWLIRRRPRLTLWCPHGLAMLAAPAQRVEVRRHDVAPEVGATVVLVALVPQQQQLATCGDDVSHPVRAVGLRAHAHLQLHARRQARLQALVHLKRRQRSADLRKTGNPEATSDQSLFLNQISSRRS